VEEIAEADGAELQAIPGMGNEAQIAALQDSARLTMEKQRQLHIRQIAAKGTRISERDRMFFISGIGDRTIELLLEAGYRRVEDLAHEADMDRLALSTGLGLQKAQSIAERAQEFLKSEKEILEALRSEENNAESTERSENDADAEDMEGNK